MKTLKVNLDRKTVRSYEIHIGEEILDRLGPLLVRKSPAQRYVIVTDETVDRLHGDKVKTALAAVDPSVAKIVVPAGEAAKGIETVLEVTRRLTALGADRQTCLVALGGGVVGDLTGFAASIYLRGVPLIQIPTTLLSQVDSSIGGKTGVDTPAGKNLLGTFHQPKVVFIDLAFLRTLPEEDFRSGLAEVIKYGVIDTPELLADVEAAAVAGTLRDAAFLERIVAASCRIKKGLVELDEHDAGVRRILNFGHTFGHAVEAASGYSLSHGRAVAIGMAAAALLSERLYGLPSTDRERITAAIRAVGLPERIPKSLNAKEIVSRLAVDKKRKEGTVRFVLIRKLGLPFVNGAIPEEAIKETLRELREE